MSFEVLWRYMPSLLGGFGVTVLCWSLGAALGLVLGFAIALLNRLRFAPLRWLLQACVEIIRGTPFLMQLFLLYAGGPFIGLRLSATTAGVVGLGLYSSAYFAEIFRGGFNAVPVGLVEAAISVGMKPFDSFTADEPEEKSTKVLIDRVEIAEDGRLVLIRVVGSHFLWRMVRRMVGVLVAVGRGELEATEIPRLLGSKSDLPATLTAPSSGLFLEGVYYRDGEGPGPLTAPIRVL